MKAITARLCDDVHYSAGVFPILCAVIARLDAEFLQSIWKRKRLIHVGVFIYVVAAVELIADRILPGPVCRKSHCARERLGCALIRSSIGGVHGARDQKCEVRGIPAIQRELGNTLLLDDLI